MTSKKWVVLGLGVAAVLTSCTSSGHNTKPPTSSTAVPSSSSSSASTTSTVPVTTTTTTTTSSTTVAAGPVRCATGSLVGALTNSNGAAGSVYYTMVLTNHGSTTCVLQGWPGVSFVTAPDGQQVGAAAERISGAAPYVTLAPGAGAGAALQIVEASNYGAACGLTTVPGLRVFPPNQTASLYIAHSDQACTNTNDVILHVGAFQPLG